MSDERQPILCSGADWEYPAAPFSITMLEISSSPVRAVMVTSPEISVPALVMNIFDPFDHPLPRLQAGGCPRGARVRAGSGLGQAEGGEPLARGQRRQPPVALLVGSEPQDRGCTE